MLTCACIKAVSVFYWAVNICREDLSLVCYNWACNSWNGDGV